MPQPVLIDCDPGIDDTLALMYLAALHHAGEIELVGVTTTPGNTSTEQTARNAAWVLEQCGLGDIPVAAGRARPLEVDLVTTPETHGEHGLGYLPSPVISCGHDWEELWQRAAARNAHLVITGPLTNAAYFARRAPLGDFSALTVMGGAVNYRGNTTPTAEWNFWVDPHAARDFFDHLAREGLRATVCSLQVTERFLLGPAELDTAIVALGTHPLAGLLPELLRFYFEFHQAQGEGYQAQIHDLLTCMVALRTIQADVNQTYMAVEAESPLTRGTSVADLRGIWGKPANICLLERADYPQAHREFVRACEILARQVG